MEELDAAKVAVEERRVQLDEKRFAIEEKRAQREGRFLRANLAIIITALISIGTLIGSVAQFYYSQVQEKEKRASDIQARLDDQRLKILEYLSANRAGIFSNDDSVRRQYRTIMLTALPRDSLAGVFEQLRQTTSGGEKIWVIGTITYEWRPSGTGDCSGRDVGLSGETEKPVQDRCDAGFEGRIAVCWDGKNFRNGPNKWCTYKLATPETCTGGNARGIMYQCTTRIVQANSASP